LEALFEINDLSHLGHIAGVHTGAVTGSIPLTCTNGADKRYIRVYQDGTTT